MVKIIIVDDHPLVCSGLRGIIEETSDWEVTKVFYTANSFFEWAAYEHFDIAIVDLNLPDAHGFDILKYLSAFHSNVKPLVISGFLTDEFILGSIYYGAKGIIAKTDWGSNIIRAISIVLSDCFYASDTIAGTVLNCVKVCYDNWKQNPFDKLSQKEIEILILLTQGKSIIEIADILFLSVRTIENHKAHIYSKLEIKNIVDLTHFAIRYGYIPVK